MCAVQDDFGPIHEALRTAEGIVRVSAVYRPEMTERFRAFFDRLRRCEAGHNRVPEGKRCLPVAVREAPDGEVWNASHRWRGDLRMWGCGSVTVSPWCAAPGKMCFLSRKRPERPVPGVWKRVLTCTTELSEPVKKVLWMLKMSYCQEKWKGP